MAKPNTETRFAKVKHVHFANGGNDLIPTLIKKRVTSASGRSDSNSANADQSVASANGRSDLITTASEQFVASNPNLVATSEVFVSPVSTFVESEEDLVCKHRDRDAENFQLAIYIAMAHAGLVLAIAICYGVGLLLKDYWTPMHWAILTSMPLHRVQGVIVKFWKQPLRLGLFQTILAIPSALLFALLESARDIREACQALLARDSQPSTGDDNVTFSKLFQWLLFLGTCTLSYEYLGLMYMIAVICVACVIYKSLSGIHSVVTAEYTDWVPLAHERRGSAARLLDFTVHASRWSNRGLAQTLIRNLSFLVALGLIVSMILVIVGGIILFSFKIGVETNDAVITLKSKVEAGTGFSNWLGINSTSRDIDSFMMNAYDTAVRKVNAYAEKNNMTAVVHTAKAFLDVISYNGTTASRGSGTTTDGSSFWDEFVTMGHILKEMFERRELRGIIKNLVNSGGGFMTGSFDVLVVLGLNVASFVKQMVIFVAVLFFLITSESGGVMEQALGMIPLSEDTRQKCATVLDRAISAVLLHTGMLMLFQALFTYLLFRFLKVHFLYVSTSIAMVQGLMPVFPKWIASLPALLQLLFERKFLCGVSTVIIYKYVMDYGVIKIQGVVSNYNQYLTGLSIAGGMTLFQPAIKGVIMGPLLMTVLVAIRDLYSEFVLKVVTAYQGN